jgi:hypothetical protein
LSKVDETLDLIASLVYLVALVAINAYHCERVQVDKKELQDTIALALELSLMSKPVENQGRET